MIQTPLCWYRAAFYASPSKVFRTATYLMIRVTCFFKNPFDFIWLTDYSIQVPFYMVLWLTQKQIDSTPIMWMDSHCNNSRCCDPSLVIELINSLKQKQKTIENKTNLDCTKPVRNHSTQSEQYAFCSHLFSQGCNDNTVCCQLLKIFRFLKCI